MRLVVKTPNGDIAVDLTREQRDLLSRLYRQSGHTPCGTCGAPVDPHRYVLVIVHHPECIENGTWTCECGRAYTAGAF